jgi:epoxyqueuosine reductase
LRKGLRPVASGITKRGTGQSSQEVCPWISFAEPTGEAAFLPRAGVDRAALVELMSLSQEEFSRRFKGSAVKRTKRRGLLRNVAVALGNWGSSEAVPVLVEALSDAEPLVRGHAGWALGRIASREGYPPEVASQVGDALTSRLFVEEDEWVREELSLALSS